MRLLRISMSLAVMILMLLMPVPSQATTISWITIDPPSSTPIPGSTFSTDINISSWNGVIGSFDLNISYDSTVLHIINFTVSPDSPFYSRYSVDQNSFTSGETQIVAFQVTNLESWTSPVSLGNITWKVVGKTGSMTNVTIKPNEVVESNWNSVEVLTYGQQIIIGSIDQQKRNDDSAFGKTFENISGFNLSFNLFILLIVVKMLRKSTI